jgi:hypothetical protein
MNLSADGRQRVLWFNEGAMTLTVRSRYLFGGTMGLTRGSLSCISGRRLPIRDTSNVGRAWAGRALGPAPRTSK